MKPRVPVRYLACLVTLTCSSLCETAAANAACVRNDTSKTLYVIMSSSSGKLERTFYSGETICKAVPKREKAKVNILPFGGARFGCRTEILADQTVGLTQFGTMNKCAFQSQ